MNTTYGINSSKELHNGIISKKLQTYLQLSEAIDQYFRNNIFPIIFGIGSFWNLLIIIYFVKINTKNLRKMSSYHFLMISLAFADLCVSLGTSIIYPFSKRPSWELGEFGCVFFHKFYRFCLSNGFMLVAGAYLVRKMSSNCLSITCKNQQKEVWFRLFINLVYCFSFEYLYVHDSKSQ